MSKEPIEGAHRGANVWRVDPENDVWLVMDKTHPLYDERVLWEVDEALVRDIMTRGVLDPVKVTKKYGDKVIVVDGRQRVKAAREANRRLAEAGKVLVRLPVIFIDRGADDAALLGVAVSSNENRLEDTPINRARKAVLLQGMGYSLDEVATAFGKTKTAVANWLKLNELDKNVIHALEARKLSAEAALKLHGLDAEAQKKALAEVLASGAGTNGSGAPNEITDTRPTRARKPTARTARQAAAKAGKTPGGYDWRPKREINAEIERLAVGKIKSDRIKYWLEALRWVRGEGG
jgi:ParB family chromosome partitioning protein